MIIFLVIICYQLKINVREKKKKFNKKKKKPNENVKIILGKDLNEFL
jgi:hypothetical protein